MANELVLRALPRIDPRNLGGLLPLLRHLYVLELIRGGAVLTFLSKYFGSLHKSLLLHRNLHINDLLALLALGSSLWDFERNLKHLLSFFRHVDVDDLFGLDVVVPLSLDGFRRLDELLLLHGAVSASDPLDGLMLDVITLQIARDLAEPLPTPTTKIIIIGTVLPLISSSFTAQKLTCVMVIVMPLAVPADTFNLMG